MWPFAAGDVLTLQVWNLGLYGYYSSSPNGAYSRMQVQYLGPLQ